MCFSETISEETWWAEERAALVGTASGASWCLWLRCGLARFDCHISRRLKLGQMQTEFPLHAGEGRRSETVAAYVVCSHRRKVLHCGFGCGHGANRAAGERVGLNLQKYKKKEKELCTCRNRYLLPSEVDVKPSLQQFISYQGYAKLRRRSEDSR